MSYILEALKRADAERDRGAVPTLHSHALPPAPAAPARMPVANWVAAIAVLALVVGAALWWTLGRQPAAVVLSPAVPAANVAVAPPAVAMLPTPLPVPAPPPVATTQTTRPAAAATPRKTTETPRPAPATKPEAKARDVAQTAPTTPAAPAATAPRGTAATAATPPASAPASAGAPSTQGVIYNVSELPDDIRSQLPKLNISGATYSAQAAYRMLIVNGQVLHEKDEPAPGLTVDTIRQNDVVLRYKGYRYSVGY